MIRYVYFDLGNVLLSFDHGRAIRQLSELANADEGVVRQLILDDGWLVKYETGLVDSDELHRRFCESVKCEVDKKHFLLAYSDIFDPIDETIRLVEQLRNTGLSLGILSNTSSAHWDHVCDRYHFLPGPFRNFVLSFEVGAMKPEGAIYQAAIEAAGCRPEEIFFCDDREENVEAAARHGIDAVRFETPAQLESELRRRTEERRIGP